jgi:hypothetical protein
MIPLSGLAQNYQKALVPNQIHYGSHLNTGPYNSGENRKSGVQSFHQPIQENFFDSQGNSIQGH